MKILLYTDNHYCATSSAIKSQGTKYSARLENQIKSINWVEQLAKDNNVDLIVCLGDFFDKPHLTDEELTALKEINWNNNILHYFIVGNHEAISSDLIFNTVKALEDKNRIIVNSPTSIELDNVELDFLPYIIENNRKSLAEYFGPQGSKKRIILSHNDIKGIRYGAFESKEGFEISDIEANCDLFVNGHLHNGTWITKKIRNLGNLTGQDFKEDAFKYSHYASIIDLDTLQMTDFENPYAFNIYKFEITTEKDLAKLNKLKTNAIVSIKCNEVFVEAIKNKLETLNAIHSRLSVIPETEVTTDSTNVDCFSIDHLKEFARSSKDNIENSLILNQELQIICSN